jgi:toxin ParE1/3/4
MKVTWSPLAIDRVSEIGAYIHAESPVAAEEWIRKIFRRVLQLESFPKSGRGVPERRRPDLKELVWGNYRIIYRVAAREVAILTVRHVKQILPLDELGE